MSQKIKVTQIRSKIGSDRKQKCCLIGLGLKKINSFSILNNSPEVRGMIRKVSHLVKIETEYKNEK